MNSCKPSMPNTVKKKTQKSMTLPIMGMARMTVPMSVRMPGSTESVRNGRKTRTTLSADALFPTPGARDTRDTTTTTKSITFQPSRR